MTPPPPINGRVAPGFEPARDAFEANWREAEEIGAAFALFRDGEPVVDLWGGWADRKRERVWQADTIVPVFSTGKAVAALVMAWLVERGLIDYDAPVARYWPDYAASGKADVTVAQALSHQDGLPGLVEPMEASDWFDRNLIETRLAAMAPMWPLEEGGSGYHPITFGFIADAIARRTDGRSIGGILREEIAGPRGIDVLIGVPEAEFHRCAEHLLPPRAPKLGVMNAYKEAAFLKPWSSPGRRGAEAWRKAEFPAANMHATARGLAEALSPFARGGLLRDERLLAPETVKAALSERVSGPDRVLPFDLSIAAGIMRNAGAWAYGPEPETVGHYGFGGSCGFADPVRGLSGAYVMNRQMDVLVGDERALRLIAAVYACL